MKYLVILTNPDDSRSAPLSFGSGVHGFQVSAETEQEAIDAVVMRAKTEGFYGYDWDAQIIPLDANSRRAPSWWMRDIQVGLYDDPKLAWLEISGAVTVRAASKAGGIRL